MALRVRLSYLLEFVLAVAGGHSSRPVADCHEFWRQASTRGELAASNTI
jgi:hypothetical protein